MENREYRECYIAFLDMLGFKKLIGQSECEEICAIFDKIEPPRINVFQGDRPAVPENTLLALKMKVMSDSICFYIDVNYTNSLLALIISCLTFQAKLLESPKPIFVRGAIVRGRMFAKDDVIFGPGLTQAYLLEERNAKYPRIILTNEVLEHARQGNDSLLHAINDDWTYRDFDAFYALNPMKLFLFVNRSKKTRENLSKMIQKVLDTTLDESIREKYLYLERVLAEHCPEEDDSHA